MMTTPGFKSVCKLGQRDSYVMGSCVIVGLKDQLTITLLVDKLAPKQLTA